MTTDDESNSIDLIRWTFAVPAEAAEAVETYLGDLGADVFVREGAHFQVNWEEPEKNLDSIVEALWSIVGTPVEITQEEFHRMELHVLQHVEDHSKPVETGEFHPGLESLDIREL